MTRARKFAPISTRDTDEIDNNLSFEWDGRSIQLMYIYKWSFAEYSKESVSLSVPFADSFNTPDSIFTLRLANRENSKEGWFLLTLDEKCQ